MFDKPAKPCLYCKYDLQASTERCPECGMPIDEDAMAERDVVHPWAYWAIPLWLLPVVWVFVVGTMEWGFRHPLFNPALMVLLATVFGTALFYAQDRILTYSALAIIVGVDVMVGAHIVLSLMKT